MPFIVVCSCQTAPERYAPGLSVRLEVLCDPSADETESGPSEDDFDYKTICDGSSATEKIPSIFMGPDLDVFQNPKTKSLHSRAKGATGKLTCGRSAQG